MGRCTPLLALLPLLAAIGPSSRETRAAPPAFDATQCLQRLESARQELLDRGFHPTTDGDTARWLRVSQEDGLLAMNLVMRSSADGPQTGYFLFISKAKQKSASSWRLTRRPVCCDEHHDKSDNIVEHKWCG